jgi:predicted nucleic acid-binding Zn ribbon protein
VPDPAGSGPQVTASPPAARPWSAEGTELACAFVRERTGVTGTVPLRARRSTRRADLTDQSWSGAGADRRDPAPAAAALEEVLAERGWQPTVAVHSVTGRWAEIVGADVAAHTRVEGFDAGVLLVRCDSTAWATQLRALAPDLMRRMAEEVGAGVVREVRVLAPTAPSWVHGPRRVKGRGPRDTYG